MQAAKTATFAILDEWTLAAVRELYRSGELYGEFDGETLTYPEEQYQLRRARRVLEQEDAIRADSEVLDAYSEHLKACAERGPFGKDEFALPGVDGRFPMRGADFMGHRRTEALSEEGLLKKCRRIKAEHRLIYTFTGIKPSEHGTLIKGFILAKGTLAPQAVTFLIKYPGNLSWDLIVSHDPGNTVLQDRMTPSHFYKALENE